MSWSALGERYARALFELGEETGQLDSVTRQLGSFAETYAASAELRSVLDNPFVEAEARENILDAVAERLGLGPLVKNTVRLLAARHRFAALPDVGRALMRLTDERLGIVRAKVTSATPLPESFCTRLQNLLERQTNHRVVLDRELDPSLIAGVITRIGDHVVDGSLDGRLTALERRLLAT